MYGLFKIFRTVEDWGDYIGIVNSDDYYEVDTVESIVQLVNNGKEADVFFGDIFYINPYFPKKVLRDDCRGDILKNGGFIWHPSVFIKSSCYREHGLYDLKYMITADYELLMRYEYENLVFQYINKPLSNFRSGGVSSYNMKCIYEKYHYQKKYYKSKFFLLLHIKDIVKQFIKISAIKFVGQRLYHKFQYRYLFSQFQKVDI